MVGLDAQCPLHKADMLNALTNVRFEGNKGHDENLRQQGYRRIYRSKNG